MEIRFQNTETAQRVTVTFCSQRTRVFASNQCIHKTVKALLQKSIGYGYVECKWDNKSWGIWVYIFVSVGWLRSFITAYNINVASNGITWAVRDE